ncbi:phage terminase small subunit [Laribacter hongkongensis]|uniref:Phage small terminase subunit n=1 Tax=Laribacter hongkongensis TaxID=168471 RepID=A0A248LIM0_9NEIS|nr:terminase endonuclease subunit [Laribacter hongkongensis]ASJ24304.1 phage small terminase subunit [Laribacter hongkongensis]MCG9041985.1 terminase endonuclease subunit [Laribacter hongkongensis]MCG9069011.1 terminase endonuclease subunit [Laribacter hongkongensis]MCG9087707.1 terminase endonuclease subunit [Laribacter hongkongensis]MCG9110822.1 terminase endonuclease subunit [Laribacter hongkongensis]
MNPARAHYQRVIAAQASASAADEPNPAHASQYELMLMKLAGDRRHLKQVQSMEGKAEVKRQVLPDYAPWVEGVLLGDSGAQDDVLMTVMLWRIDAGDYMGALDIGDYAIRHGLTMPDQYQRSTATTLAEEIADAAKRARDGKAAFDVAVLVRIQHLTVEQDMHDPVRAKLLKELGLALEQAGHYPQAVDLLARAMQLHDKVGVKKDIERIERSIRNTAATSS